MTSLETQKSPSKTKGYEFGPFRLDMDLQALVCDGKEVEVQRKVLEVLQFLIENRHRTVTKDELQQEVWRGSVVSETALTRAVMKARRALGDDGGDPAWIRTVHGRGYRFIGEVREEAADENRGSTPIVSPGATVSASEIEELKQLQRRNFFRVLTAYAALGWLINQGAALLWEAFEWPRLGQQILLLVSLAGIVPTAILGWLFLATPEGLRRPGELIGRHLAPGRWVSRATIAMLSLALATSIYWNLRPPAPVTEVPVIADQSVAVLPFRNLTGSEELDYFSDGLTVTFLQELGSLQGLRVVAQTSSAYFKDSLEPLTDIARRLRVSHLLQGSVQRMEDRVRVDTMILEGASGQQLWSKRFEADLDDLFEVQDVVSRDAIQALARLLDNVDGVSAEAARRGSAQRGTNNLAAYQAYLEGLKLQGLRTTESLSQALEKFEEALALDPTYAKAWSSFGLCRMNLAVFGVGSRPQGFAEALSAANTAIGYDPTLALPYRVLAEIQSRYEWDLAGAERSIRTAVELAPGDTDVATSYGGILSKLGRQDEAVEVVRNAWSLDPLNANIAASLTIREIRAGQIDAAEHTLSQLLALKPDHGDRHWLNALLQLGRGDYRAAIDAIEQDDLEYLRLSISSIALYHLGDEAGSQAQLAQLIETDSEGAAFQIAEVYAQRGENDEAFSWLERAYASRDPGFAELRASRFLKPLADDPRFQELESRLQLE